MAATSAGFITNPLEVVKHHMEMSKKSQFQNKCAKFFHTGYTVAKADGLKSLQKGLSPALGAYLASYGMKLGLDSVIDFFVEDKNHPVDLFQISECGICENVDGHRYNSYLCNRCKK
ncbi:unnamed protein product [Phaedon cochleariae]|uniref:Uncharacterized protein n=1 Tax=Phaedon cochleariae TaxID=80249 RepID=A0A9N9SAF5_PHACE|nr:unnamed protein product [Phaedon cochleariae]